MHISKINYVDSKIKKQANKRKVKSKKNEGERTKSWNEKQFEIKTNLNKLNDFIFANCIISSYFSLLCKRISTSAICVAVPENVHKFDR